MRWVLLGLVLLLGWLQYRLWFGIGSVGEVEALQSQVEQQRRENGGLQERNDALAAEVRDLKEGVAAVEERARSELGMIRPGEVFYRVVEDPGQRPPPPLPEAVDDAAGDEEASP
jgi:cell division protein FtsB